MICWETASIVFIRKKKRLNSNKGRHEKRTQKEELHSWDDGDIQW